MSAVLVLACDTCEVAGPLLRNHLGETALLQAREGNGPSVWAEFLTEHEWHGGLRLYMEATPAGYQLVGQPAPEGDPAIGPSPDTRH